MNRANYQKLNAPAFHALLALEKALAETPIERTIFDLVRIRASQLNGCLFCVDMHSKEARTHEERELRLYHLAAWRESPLFNERERAALDWTERLTKKDSHGIDEAQYAQVREVFNEKEIADLTLMIAAINAWNVLGVAFRPAPGAMDKVMGLDKIGLN